MLQISSRRILSKYRTIKMRKALILNLKITEWEQKNLEGFENMEEK